MENFYNLLVFLHHSSIIFASKQMAGLYIHIPFCASRCIYCGFYSTTLLDLQDRYIDAVCREMELRKQEFITQHPTPYPELPTIYLGGGTPSQLSAKNLQKLFYNINKVYGPFPNDPIEITMECNPDDLSEEYVAVLSQLPVNRISMGAQTFSDERLHFLHRRHTAEQVRTAIKRLRAIGIQNISIDLMFGFPNETLDDWASDINEALALDVEHISAYCLMYEEGTPLYEKFKSAKVQKLKEETERLMYERLIDRLEAAGYEHYEISNFAKEPPLWGGWRGSPSPLRSLHNSNYWNGTPYIGLGAAAHSYDKKSRSWNICDIRQYIAAIEQGQRPFEYELLNDDTRYNDLITTALRTREGINLTTMEKEYKDYLLENARLSLEQNLLRIDDNHIHLTRKGLFVSDDVMSDLIWV